MTDVDPAASVVEARLQELKDLALYLDKRSQRNIIGASSAKVVLILLGSLSAAKAALDQILGAATRGDIVLFASVGVLSAVVAGVMAAFQFESRASTIAQLAAEADAAWHKADAMLAQGGKASHVLDQQNANLKTIRDRAAKLGVNTILHVHEKQGLGSRPTS